ncbi:MAG TPA: alpha/beta hydrolase [Stellaceae bacterium]|nr:alpha/beta hydrolase [Stellaceae bacterium]
MWLERQGDGDFGVRRMLHAAQRLVTPGDTHQAEIERRHPPRGRFLSVGGVGLHYYDRGTGRPVVYLHGAGAVAEELFIGPLGDMLARRHRVVAIDRPGHGFSGYEPHLAGPRAQAKLLHAALGRLGIERPILVGHSWGGALALAYATKYPQNVSGLVCIAAWCFAARQTSIALMTSMTLPLIEAMVGRSFAPSMLRRFGRRTVGRIFEPDPVPAYFTNYPLELSLRIGQLRANGRDLLALNPDMMRIQRFYRRLAVPLEVVVGSADRIVDPHRHGRRLAVMVPGARLTNIAGAGHMPHHLDPTSITAAVERLLG